MGFGSQWFKRYSALCDLERVGHNALEPTMSLDAFYHKEQQTIWFRVGILNS